MNTGASTYAGLVDQAFYFIFGISILLLLGITAAMLFFIFKYSRKRNPQATQIEGNLKLEVLWTVVPTILVLAMFYYGWIGFKEMRTVPNDAMQITVKARQWSWLFEYPNGKQSTELTIPVGKPVELQLQSEDVIHSFYVPAFRLKEDCTPGRNNYAWFESTKIGNFNILCAEYCGTQHSAMLSKVHSVAETDFNQWYNETKKAEDSGLDLLNLRGCLACHSVDGSRLVGPTFKGLYGREEIVLRGETEHMIKVDDAYLKKSIIDPSYEITKGYPSLMPAQKLEENEINAIIEIIKTIK